MASNSLSFNVLKLGADGEGHTLFNLADIQIEMVTRYNYTTLQWLLDILDVDGASILNGLALVPNLDILQPYLDIKATLGALVPVELNTGDYQNPDLLGSNIQLLWYPVGVAVILP